MKQEFETYQAILAGLDDLQELLMVVPDYPEDVYQALQGAIDSIEFSDRYAELEEQESEEQ